MWRFVLFSISFWMLIQNEWKAAAIVAAVGVLTCLGEPPTEPPSADGSGVS